ncbi:MAG: EAL domain-containing protein [Burkholderiales bacterium]|nr:EAL domain-containing protein [Burkholderiales bacterium]
MSFLPHLRIDPSHARAALTSLAYSAGGQPRLGSRLVRAVLLAAGTALLVAAVALNGFAYFTLRTGFIDNLKVQALLTADHSAQALAGGDRAAAALELGCAQAAPTLLGAVLFDSSGRLFASCVARSSADAHSLTDLESLPVDPVQFGRSQVRVLQGVKHAGRDVGHIVVVASLDRLYRRMAEFVAASVLVVLAALALAFALVARIRREMDASESQLDQLAYVDPVTKLPNRHAANAQIQRMIERVGKGSEGFALMLLDLDNFKIVNDTLGHPVGDELLHALALRLTEQLPRSDMVFRYGGDEFLILSEGYREPEQLRLIGQFTLLTLDTPLKVGPHELQVRGCVGLAQFPRDAADASNLVRAADTAMYRAKSLGKNSSAVFEADMDHTAKRRIRIDSELRRAVARDELHLQYQPIVDLISGRMVGVEALLRWQHPDLGMIAPAEFIPVAESSGLIADIGQWVLHAACAQMQRWHLEGETELYVAINVSGRQLKRGLVRQLDAALAASGLDPSCVELEIAEQSLVDNIEPGIAQMSLLKKRGIRLSIDNFGTGFTSLNCVKRLPVDKLKIDMTFVKDLPNSADDAAIATSIVSLAQGLNLKVVGEGVQTQLQHEFLRHLGCDLAQGFLYSRPVTAERMSRFLVQRLAESEKVDHHWPNVSSALSPLMAD